ncbi:hypothetical protein [Pseudomonas gingeri]|uniref:Uncharacterized protein n=1 Tax=Pseudomonas gingeri TaxID=117681 RepID=A0A7Y8CK65_9PSED|nr:hypothetical protein [Pseudomonas gingeri]NWB29034.1 hypothetical protein [Pseudomonas gingeri]NWC34128.1 hypothetical protein [Pseudomonas gingeri]
MKLSFFWGWSFGELAPRCTTGVCNEDGVDLLACLLLDGGGAPYLEAAPLIDNGLLSIQRVRTESLKESEWIRECWGAVFSVERVRISSLYDENYFVDMDLDDFERALSEWKSFIVSG